MLLAKLACAYFIHNDKKITYPCCEVPTAVLLRAQIVSDVTQFRCLGPLSPWTWRH